MVCIGVGILERQLFEQPAEFQFSGRLMTIPERAVVVVFTDQGHRVLKIRVGHAGHGDQQLVCRRNCPPCMQNQPAVGPSTAVVALPEARLLRESAVRKLNSHL